MRVGRRFWPSYCRFTRPKIYVDLLRDAIRSRSQILFVSSHANAALNNRAALDVFTCKDQRWLNFIDLTQFRASSKVAFYTRIVLIPIPVHLYVDICFYYVYVCVCVRVCIIYIYIFFFLISHI